MPKNPPHLVNVEFTIWWHLYTKKERDNAQLIHGDLHNALQKKYPKRTVTNQDLFIFKERDDSDTEIELTKESLTFSSDDNKYDWIEYEKNVQFILKGLFPILEKYLDLDHIHLELQYVDCFEENFTSISIVDFYKNNLNLSIDSNFVDKKPSNLNVKFEYNLEIGNLEVQVGNGKYLDEHGILLVSKINSKKEKFELENSLSWLSKAHEISSQLYKNVTQKKS